MKIREIVLNNFRPYFGVNKIDMSGSNSDKNIILIGGKNGQGKTSLLLGMVWCLYGKAMTNVDEVFKQAIGRNYNKWLDTSLNRRSKKDGELRYSVSMTFDDVYLSQFNESNNQTQSVITIERSLDVSTKTVRNEEFIPLA